MRQIATWVRLLAVICMLVGLLGLAVEVRADDATPPVGVASSVSSGTGNGSSGTGNETATTTTTDPATVTTTVATAVATDPAPTATDAGSNGTASGNGTVSGAPTGNSTGPDATAPADNGTDGSTSGPANADVVAAAATPGADVNSTNGTNATSTSNDVTVTVSAYACPSDPGGQDPTTFCTGADGVGVRAVANDQTDLGTATTKGGTATVSAPKGASVYLEVDPTTIPQGYQPLGQTTQTLSDVQSGASAMFLFVKTGDSGSGQGKVQLTNITCPTSGQSTTTWKVIGVGLHAAAAAQSQACGPKANGAFTITGGSLGSGGQSILTDDNGSWRGVLDAGDYTATEDASGSSQAFTVQDGATTILIATDYVAQPNGTLGLRNYTCAGATEHTDITVGSTPSLTGCDPAVGDFQIDAGNPFSVDQNGGINLPIPSGSYTLTDKTSGQTAPFTITEGQTTTVVVQHFQPYGTVAVTALSCADPVPQDVDASDPTYWSANCTGANANVDMALVNGNGDVVDTTSAGADGSASFDHVQAGSYTVQVPGECAAFVGGDDASGGFSVAAGQTVNVTIYSCQRASDNGGGDNGGGDTGDGTGGVGGNTGGQLQTGGTTTTTASVTTLPNTGAHGHAGTATLPWLLMAGAVMSAAAGIGVDKRRRWRAR